MIHDGAVALAGGHWKALGRSVGWLVPVPLCACARFRLSLPVSLPVSLSLSRFLLTVVIQFVLLSLSLCLSVSLCVSRFFPLSLVLWLCLICLLSTLAAVRVLPNGRVLRSPQRLPFFMDELNK
jgi:hypothetical protein